MSTWAITRGSCGSGLATGIARCPHPRRLRQRRSAPPEPLTVGLTFHPTLKLSCPVGRRDCVAVVRLRPSSRSRTLRPAENEAAAAHGFTEASDGGNCSSPLTRLHDVFCEVRAACIRLWIGKGCHYASFKVQYFSGMWCQGPEAKISSCVENSQENRNRFQVKGLSNVKEEVYGALDSFVAWELEFPLIAVKKALKTLEDEKEWKRIIQVIKWMFNKGQGKTMGSYYTLLNALIEDGRVEEAEELYGKIFSRYLEGLPRTFFMRMISLYYRLESYQKMFEIFADMEELGVRPDGSIIRMFGEVFQKLGMLDKYVKLKKKYPPPKWEYRHIKGKRIRVKVYPKDEIEEPMRNPGTDEVEEEENMDVDSELEEAASAGLDRNVLDEAACGDLEFSAAAAVAGFVIL
uniref:Pentacotripeptide-repeat region of PRORP domain-containing protein n=1 Tax=Oryza glumipatula TaxID=40148 RepID=A0A0D9YF63_9ORYZ